MPRSSEEWVIRHRIWREARSLEDSAIWKWSGGQNWSHSVFSVWGEKLRSFTWALGVRMSGTIVSLRFVPEDKLSISPQRLRWFQTVCVNMVISAISAGLLFPLMFWSSHDFNWRIVSKIVNKFSEKPKKCISANLNGVFVVVCLFVFCQKLRSGLPSLYFQIRGCSWFVFCLQPEPMTPFIWRTQSLKANLSCSGLF